MKHIYITCDTIEYSTPNAVLVPLSQKSSYLSRNDLGIQSTHMFAFFDIAILYSLLYMYIDQLILTIYGFLIINTINKFRHYIKHIHTLLSGMPSEYRFIINSRNYLGIEIKFVLLSAILSYQLLSTFCLKICRQEQS